MKSHARWFKLISSYPQLLTQVYEHWHWTGTGMVHCLVCSGSSSNIRESVYTQTCSVPEIILKICTCRRVWISAQCLKKAFWTVPQPFAGLSFKKQFYGGVGVWSEVPPSTTCHKLKPVSSQPNVHYALSTHMLHGLGMPHVVGPKLEQYGNTYNANPSTNDPPSH